MVWVDTQQFVAEFAEDLEALRAAQNAAILDAVETIARLNPFSLSFRGTFLAALDRGPFERTNYSDSGHTPQQVVGALEDEVSLVDRPSLQSVAVTGRLDVSQLRFEGAVPQAFTPGVLALPPPPLPIPDPEPVVIGSPRYERPELL